MIKAKKNAVYYLSFPAINSSTPESYVSGESIVDSAYYKDGVGAWTSMAIADTVSEIGSTGVYELDLSASELNHDKVLIKFTSTNMADDMVMFDLSAKLVDDLQDLSAAQVNAECDTAIADAALATAANLAVVDGIVDAILVDSGTTIPALIAALNNVSAADVNAQCDLAISDAALATAANLAVVDGIVDTILVDSGTTIPALIAALNNVSAADVNAQCDLAISDAALATAANLAVVDGIVDAILVDVGTTIPALIAALNNVSAADVNAQCDLAISDAALATAANLAVVDGIVDAILVDSGTTIPALIAALNNVSAANVKAQVVAALSTDTYAEPSGGITSTASLASKLGFLTTVLRNKTTFNKNTGVKTVRNDADSADIVTSTNTDDGTTFTKGEYS